MTVAMRHLRFPVTKMSVQAFLNSADGESKLISDAANKIFKSVRNENNKDRNKLRYDFHDYSQTVSL